MFNDFLKKIAIIVITGCHFMVADSIVVIDDQRLITESKAAKSMQQLIRNEFEGRWQEISENVEKLKNMVQKAEVDAEVMTKAEQVAMKRDIEKFEREVQQMHNNIEEDYRVRMEEKLREFSNKFANFIEQYSIDNDIDIIIQKSHVVFNKDALNITDDVLVNFDALQE